MAVGTTSIVIRGERRSPFRRTNLIRAIWTRPDVVEATPAASMADIDRRPRVIEALKPDVSLNEPFRAMAIAAYRRSNMTAPTPGPLLIDTYL